MANELRKVENELMRVAPEGLVSSTWGKALEHVRKLRKLKRYQR